MGFLDRLFEKNKKNDERKELENTLINIGKENDLKKIASQLNNIQKEKLNAYLQKDIKTNANVLFDKMQYEDDPSKYWWDFGNKLALQDDFELSLIIQQIALEKSTGEWKSVVMETIGDLYLELNLNSEALKYHNDAYLNSNKNNPYRMRDLMRQMSKSCSVLNMSQEVGFYNNKAEEYQKLYLEEREKSKNNPKKEEDSDLPY